MEWWGWLCTGFGAITILAEGIKAVRSLVSPIVKFGERVKTLESGSKKRQDEIQDLGNRLDETNEHLADVVETQEKTNQAIIKGMVAVINHMIDGNGIEGLKNARDDMTKFLIER